MVQELSNCIYIYFLEIDLRSKLITLVTLK